MGKSCKLRLKSRQTPRGTVLFWTLTDGHKWSLGLCACVCVYKINVVVTYLGWCRWHCKSWKQGSVSESVCVYPRPPLAPLDWHWVRAGEARGVSRDWPAHSQLAVPAWLAKRWWQVCPSPGPELASDCIRWRKCKLSTAAPAKSTSSQLSVDLGVFSLGENVIQDYNASSYFTIEY